MSRWQFRSEGYWLRFDLTYLWWVMVVVFSSAITIVGFIDVIQSSSVASLKILVVTGFIAFLAFIRLSLHQGRERDWRERVQYVRRYGRPIGIFFRRHLRSILILSVVIYAALIASALHWDTQLSRKLWLGGALIVLLDIIVIAEALTVRLPSPNDPDDDDLLAEIVARRMRRKYRRYLRMRILALPFSNTLINAFIFILFFSSLVGTLWALSLALTHENTIVHSFIATLLCVVTLIIGWIFLSNTSSHTGISIVPPPEAPTVHQENETALRSRISQNTSSRMVIFSRIILNIAPIIFIVAWIYSHSIGSLHTERLQFYVYGSVFIRVVIAYLIWDTQQDMQSDEAEIDKKIGYGGLIYTDDGAIVPREALADYRRLQRRRFLRRFEPIGHFVAMLVLILAIYGFILGIHAIVVEGDGLLKNSLVVVVTFLFIGGISWRFGQHWLNEIRDTLDELRFGPRRADWAYEDAHQFDPTIEADDFYIDA